MILNWWTLFFQTVNVLILIWLLGKFFWKPVSAMIAARRAQAQEALDEGESKKRTATAALDEIARTRAGFAQERAAILKSAEEDAEKARAAQLAQAKQEAAALQDAAAAAIAREKTDAEKAWAQRASALAVEIAGKLLAPLESPALQDSFFERLVAEIEKLLPPQRAGIASAGALELVSARPVAPQDQERYRKRLGEILQIPTPEIGFRTDPALIAGLELHSPHLLVTNSWRADLNKILEDIGE